MKKKIIGIILAFLFVIVSGITIVVYAASSAKEVNNTKPVATISEVYIPSEPLATKIEETIPEPEVIVLENVEIKRVDPTTLEEANIVLEDAIFRKELAVTIYENLLSLGYSLDHPAVVMVQTDIETEEKYIIQYTEQKEILQEKYEWEIRINEYPIASQVWLYMKNEFGWNDIVCAGIIGNMMAECGGCWTSDLDWELNESCGLGMIQWIGGRRKAIINLYGEVPTVEEQLLFMRDEMYGTNGVTQQITESQLNKIMNAETPEECAFAFATYFERCAEEHRAPRRGYATRAYEYFVG